MKPASRLIFAITLLFLAKPSLGQHQPLGAWDVVTIKLGLDKHWSLLEESQIRSQNFFRNFNYYEFKGGLGYSFSRKLSALVGFGRMITFSDGHNFAKPFVNKEWRIWEQFIYNMYTGRVKLENRIRVEQRWTSSLGYRNRIKYRLNCQLPLNGRRIRPGVVYLTGWDELYFTDSNPNFESTRMFGGLGLQLSKHTTIQTGYLHQVLYKADDTHSGRQYFQTVLVLDLDAHRQHHQDKTPTSAD